jgi:hypothetical protein
MRLVPDQDSCPDHGAPLTPLVEAELRTDPDLVDSAFLRSGRRRKGLRPYLVIVTCPGTGSADSHPISLTGSWEP